MLVYRMCSDMEIKCYLEGRRYCSMLKKFGVNTFKYSDDTEYIHFYLFPESCLRNVYYVPIGTGYIICDIPKELLDKYFGYGYYPDIIDGKYVPLPEFAIPTDLFSLNYIKSINDVDSFKESLNQSKYDDYLGEVVDKYAIDYNSGKSKSNYVLSKKMIVN